MADDDDGESARTLRKRAQRRAGDASARLASALMKLAPALVGKLELDDDLRAAVNRARAVTSLIARRRAERALAGDLRRTNDLAGLSRQLASVEEIGAAEPRRFHLAETWRERLIEGGVAAAAEFPGASDPRLAGLIEQAQREHATGRPPGAKRALFRYVMAALQADAHAASDDE